MAEVATDNSAARIQAANQAQAAQRAAASIGDGSNVNLGEIKSGGEAGQLAARFRRGADIAMMSTMGFVVGPMENAPKAVITATGAAASGAGTSISKALRVAAKFLRLG